MSAGYSGTPLWKKLGIRSGSLAAFVGAPDAGAMEPGGQPAHRRIAASVEAGMSDGPARIRTDLRARGPYDVIVAFVRSDRELRARFEAARPRLTRAGGLWVAWPKQSSPLATSLKESDVRRYGLSTGLVDNKVCAVDEDWSGLRFVVRTKDRSG